MKNWQKYWLYLVILFSTLHIVRDILQGLGVRNFLSTFLESPGPPKVSLVLYYTLYNTYLIAIVEIMLAVICLRRNEFGKLGKATIIIALSFFALWSHYYFVL